VDPIAIHLHLYLPDGSGVWCIDMLVRLRHLGRETFDKAQSNSLGCHSSWQIQRHRPIP